MAGMRICGMNYVTCENLATSCENLERSLGGINGFSFWHWGIGLEGELWVRRE